MERPGFFMTHCLLFPCIFCIVIFVLGVLLGSPPLIWCFNPCTRSPYLLIKKKKKKCNLNKNQKGALPLLIYHFVGFRGFKDCGVLPAIIALSILMQERLVLYRA
jgi:hypothetical protein